MLFVWYTSKYQDYFDLNAKLKDFYNSSLNLSQNLFIGQPKTKIFYLLKNTD